MIDSVGGLTEKHDELKTLCQQGLMDCRQIEKAHRIEPMFDDSSCILWRLDLVKSNRMIFKTAKLQQVSPFWQMMQSLFGLAIEDGFRQAAFNYSFIQQAQALQIPAIVNQYSNKSSTNLLMSFIPGQAVKTDQVNQEMVEDLAKYLSGLHANQMSDFGSIKLAIENQQACSNSITAKWRQKLSQTLNDLTVGLGSETILQACQNQIDDIKVSHFVPMMMDLRWDQFAQQKGRLTGVFDLDAYVSAPIELDFVILEYLLTPQQLDWFIAEYMRTSQLEVPNIETQREVYRSLFYLVNALGEPDYSKWMSQPKYFD